MGTERAVRSNPARRSWFGQDPNGLVDRCPRCRCTSRCCPASAPPGGRSGGTSWRTGRTRRRPLNEPDCQYATTVERSGRLYAAVQRARRIRPIPPSGSETYPYRPRWPPRGRPHSVRRVRRSGERVVGTRRAYPFMRAATTSSGVSRRPRNRNNGSRDASVPQRCAPGTSPSVAEIRVRQRLSGLLMEDTPSLEIL